MTPPPPDLRTLTQPELAALSGLHRLLSDPTRLRIILLLCGGERNVTDLVERLGLAQPTVSHHLAQLRYGRLVATDRRGKSIFYRLTDGIGTDEGCTLRIPNASGLTLHVLVDHR